jgi:hypothetical protein
MILWGDDPIPAIMIPVTFIFMPLSTKNTFEAEIMGGIFSYHENTENVNQATLSLDVSRQDTQVIFRLDDRQARETYIEALIQAIRGGNIRVAATTVSNTVPVIEVIDDLKTWDRLDASCRAEQLNFAY